MIGRYEHSSNPLHHLMFSFMVVMHQDPHLMKVMKMMRRHVSFHAYLACLPSVLVKSFICFKTVSFIIFEKTPNTERMDADHHKEQRAASSDEEEDPPPASLHVAIDVHHSSPFFPPILFKNRILDFGFLRLNKSIY